MSKGKKSNGMLAASPSEAGEQTVAKRRGRPLGSKNEQRKIVLVRPAACPACGSTRRRPYKVVMTRAMAGRVGEQEYTHIVYRDCRCADCGRPRREAHFENRQASAGTQDKAPGG